MSSRFQTDGLASSSRSLGASKPTAIALTLRAKIDMISALKAVGIADGPHDYQPAGLPLFCVSSHFFSGAKYETIALPDI